MKTSSCMKKKSGPLLPFSFINKNVTTFQFSQSRYSSSQKLPANTVALFVPQQEAWVVERMGKFHTVLQPVSYSKFYF